MACSIDSRDADVLAASIVSRARRARVVALVIAGVAAGSTFVVGCATSPLADLAPGIDPSLPAVDASFDSAPASSGDVPRVEPEAEPSNSEEDAGAKLNGADAGRRFAVPDAAVDAGPSLPKPSPGELLISEVMYNTFGVEPESEWFELHSKALATRSLSGLTIKDGSGRTHVIGGALTLAPGAYVVFARSKAAALAANVPARAIVYEYGAGLPDNAGVLLANGPAGGVSILNGPVLLGQAPYGPWFSQSGGSSVQLRVLDSARASALASWCLSTAPWAAGSDKGTPGAASDCP